MILTSHFNNYSSLNFNEMFPISIAGKSPYWYEGFEYKKLAPKFWFFRMYKDGELTKEDYTKFYYQEVLNDLDVKTIRDELLWVANGKTPILLCYEHPTQFCHRHIVSYWLNSKYDNICKEIV